MKAWSYNDNGSQWQPHHPSQLVLSTSDRSKEVSCIRLHLLEPRRSDTAPSLAIPQTKPPAERRKERQDEVQQISSSIRQSIDALRYHGQPPAVGRCAGKLVVCAAVPTAKAPYSQLQASIHCLSTARHVPELGPSGLT